MATWNVLADLLILLSAALFLGAALERFRQSAIIGYLLAGCLLGPHALGLIESGEEVELLAELGVALLLFSIGLEVSWDRMRSCGRSALLGGVAQVIVTAALGSGIAMIAGLDPRPAVLIGCALALSSTACVLRLLQGRRELDSQHGRHSLGILLVQDLAVVPLVLVAGTMQAEGTLGGLVVGLGRALGLASLMVVAFAILFRFVIPRLLDLTASLRNRELPLLLALVTGLGSAMLAHEFGVSPAIGAFVAGLLLAGSPYSVTVRADVSALRTTFMTLFFSSIGMLADVRWFLDHALAVLGTVVAIVVLKTAIIAALLRSLGLARRPALATGIALAQAGEFAFLLVGAAGGLLSEDLFMLLTSSTFVTLLATPGLVWAAGRMARTFPASTKREVDVESHNRFVVVGFGPAGRELAAMLATEGLDVEVVDLNPQLVALARRRGFRAIVGDAAHPDTLEHAGATGAAQVAVTVPDERVVLAVTRQLRLLSKDTTVVTRARYSTFAERLKQAGSIAVDEERTVGRQMGREMLALLEEREPEAP